MTNIPIEPQQVEKEFQETDLYEYYDAFDKRLNKCIAKIETLILDYPELSMEEMAAECYACFTRLAYVACSMAEYRVANSVLLINGREEKEEQIYLKLKKLFHDHEVAMNEWVAKNVSVNIEKRAFLTKSLFDAAIKCCMECEEVLKKTTDIQRENLNPIERKMANLHALQKLFDLGVAPEQLQKLGLLSEDPFEANLDRAMANTSVLHDSEIQKNLKSIHNGILKNTPVYPHLLKSALGYITMCMSSEGWHRLLSLSDDEIKRRYIDYGKIYKLSPEYIERKKNLFIEELLEEGEPTAEKVAKFKHDFIAKYKSNELVKAYKIHNEDCVAITKRAIELKSTVDDLEDLLFYTFILEELKTYEDKAIPAVQNSDVHIHIQEYVANKGDNYGTQIVNKDGGRIELKKDNNG